jgi:D-alanyl-D-alanine carboxypeptidase
VADVDGAELEETTRFRVGSITKPIVALLVVDAAAHGELGLDDVVGDIVPGVIRAEPPITVRQLLDHTSGLFDEGNEGNLLEDVARLSDPALRREAVELFRRYEAGEQVLASPRLLVALAETHDRYFEPGTDYHYGNPGYQLAGMVLERATGMTLPDLLADRIAAPLGLSRTTIAPADRRSPEMRGYRIDEAQRKLLDVTDDLATFGNGANGGIVSTAGELLTTIEAIATGSLLPEGLAAEMTTPNLASYGLGVFTYEFACGRFLGHGGLVNGTGSIAMASPDGQTGLVIAMNVHGQFDADLTVLAERVLCGI